MASQHDQRVVIDIYGEAKTDVGPDPDANRRAEPTEGVIPILVYRLCGEPQQMLVRVRGRAFGMRKGTLERKSTMARQIARDSGSKGVVYVVDADGPDSERQSKHQKLDAGRNAVPDGPPMAIGVAQPCVEAWLLAGIDVQGALASDCANAGALGLDSPEQLPFDKEDSNHPKRLLARLCQVQQKDVSAEGKWQLAKEADLAAMAKNCPRSFQPFADEVEEHIKPLF